MSCGLLTGLASLRRRAMEHRAYALITRVVGCDRRLHCRLRMGSYLLFRGETEGSIDFEYPVGVAVPGSTPTSTIAERLTNRSVTTGTLYYAMRGVGPLGIEDEADPPDVTSVRLVGGQVQSPPPNPPVAFLAEPYTDGQVLITCMINNNAGLAPAASVSLYHDSGSGTGVDWGTPLGNPVSVGGGLRTYRFVRDPSLSHGTAVEFGLRAKSAEGVEEDNTNTRTVVLDSQGPPKMDDFTVEVVCE